MSIPSKLQNGDPFKYNVARKINEIIDTLHEQQLTAVVGGTFARTKGGTSITIGRQSAGVAGGASSTTDRYYGPLAIVKVGEQYMVGDNSQDQLDVSYITVNGRTVAVPVTVISAGSVAYLRLDLSGASIVATVTTEEVSTENVYYFRIGSVSTDGKITQVLKDPFFSFTSPIEIDSTLSAFMQVGENNILTFGDRYSESIVVPVVVNGTVTMLPASELPETAYEGS